MRRSTDLVGRSGASQTLPESIFVRSFTNGALTVADVADRAALIREAPELFHSEQDLAQRLIKLAAAIKDWDKMLLAVDLQLMQQQQFVEWWQVGVRSAHRPVTSQAHGQLSQSDAEARTGVRHQQVSRWRGWLGDDQIEAYRQRLRDVAFREAGILPKSSHRTLGTGDNEWFTPPLYVELAKSVLGEIDLDPATHPKAQKRIKAKQFYTLAQDGLKQDWSGRVWLNPPYGRSDLPPFVDKLVNHYERRDVSAAILLTHNYSDTRWFHAAAAASSMMCFTSGRINFEDSTGETCVPAQGQTFFYFGADTDRFNKHFGAVGFIATAVVPP